MGRERVFRGIFPWWFIRISRRALRRWVWWIILWNLRRIFRRLYRAVMGRSIRFLLEVIIIEPRSTLLRFRSWRSSSKSESMLRRLFIWLLTWWLRSIWLHNRRCWFIRRRRRRFLCEIIQCSHFLIRQFLFRRVTNSNCFLSNLWLNWAWSWRNRGRLPLVRAQVQWPHYVRWSSWCWHRRTNVRRIFKLFRRVWRRRELFLIHFEPRFRLCAEPVVVILEQINVCKAIGLNWFTWW